MPPLRRNALGALLALLIVTACGGGAGNAGPAGGPVGVGTLRTKPGGGLYFEDEHRSGGATRLALVEITWGRLVDVHAFDASGLELSEPAMRDFVINENVADDPGRVHLAASPITQKTRLVIERAPDAPDLGDGTFASLLGRAAEGLPAVLPRGETAGGPAPFSFVARNAVLMLRFDDLLDDDEESRQELAQLVRVLTGYPPATPLEARITFDPNHGGVAGGSFHSTRVLIDLTVSEAEAADSDVPLQLNSIGLPASERGSERADVTLRLPTRLDPGSGQFSRLTNLAGHPLDPALSPPFDPASSTLDLVRALRSGNADDPNNGFLLDFERPRLVGTWSCAVEGVHALGGTGFDWSLDLAFASVCRKTPVPGDIVTVGESFLEVASVSRAPDDDGRVRDVRVRVLNAAAPAASQLLGTGVYQTLFVAGAEVERGCWVRFSPAPLILPSTDVQPSAVTTLRFSEPIDPASARPFDSIQTVRGGESTPVDSGTLVVGALHESVDLRDVTFVPSLPYAHDGDRPLYHVQALSAGGITDLAGNELVDALPPVEFSIDPRAPPVSNGSFVMRFDSPDELQPAGAADVRGQFTYDFARGVIRPREVASASRAVDRTDPIISIMPPFPPGVATPLSPLGSKLQTVWRYADLGWSISDESKYNLDVVGVSWSPARGQVAADFFEQFEILLAHSNKLPDEQRRQPITGGMKYPLSGLWEAPVPFENNVLRDPDSPVKIMHERALGYRVDPSLLSHTATGLPLMPYPFDRDGDVQRSFTWRDTGAIAVGGDFGAGVPLDSEVGVPLFLEDVIGSFAPPGHVPTVGLPLLIELRCFPSASGIGLNPLGIVLATNTSAAPNFRAYSTGGFDTNGLRVNKNPDLELAPSGGFNPGSRPPGKPTARTADNSLYLGQLDYVIRLSRVHTIWIDTHDGAPRYAEVVLEPPEAARPPGTDIRVDFRGADRFDGAEQRPFNAATLTPYGDPRVGTIAFHGADPTWKSHAPGIDGARYVQMRFTFVNNVAAGLVAELSAVGLAFENR